MSVFYELPKGENVKYASEYVKYGYKFNGYAKS